MNRNGSNPPPMAPKPREPDPEVEKSVSGHYFPRGKKAMTRLLIFAANATARIFDAAVRQRVSTITLAEASVSVWRSRGRISAAVANIGKFPPLGRGAVLVHHL